MQFIASLLMVLIVGCLFAAMSVTRDCRQTVFANIRRMNGTLSRARIRRELAAFLDYGGNLVIPLVIAIPASLIVTEYVSQNVMPIDQIVNAFLRFSTDSNTWKESLQDSGSEHLKWLAEKGTEGAEAEVLQRTLWYGWPILLIITVSLGVFCLWGMMGLSKSAVADYANSVRTRRDEYIRFDSRRHLMSAPRDFRLDSQRSA